jgi:hypothetical protein
MKRLTIYMLVLVVIILCASYENKNYATEKIISPSGKYYLVATVNQSDNAKANYADVIIHIYGSDNQLKISHNTHAGDASKWAVG